MVLKWLGVFPVKHNWLVLNAGDNQLVEVEVEEVVVEVEVAFVDNWAVGKEKVCYWLSNDIVGLVGNLAV